MDKNINSLKKSQSEVNSRFQPKKKQSLVLARIYKALGEKKRSERVLSCGSVLEFRISEEEHKLHNANFCRDRLCPMCNWRRGKKIFSQVSKIMDSLAKKKYRFLFLTLTVKNCTDSDLPVTIEELFKGWSNLIRTKEFKKGIKGSARTLEITINKETGMCHPHLHCILAVEESYFKGGIYITQRRWSELWARSCSLDYCPVVDVRGVRNGSKGNSSAVLELSKYVSKGSDLLNGEVAEILLRVEHFLEALFHRRLFSFTGVFRIVARELSLDDPEDGDLVHVDDVLRPDLEYIIVRYCWNSGAYVLVE